MWLAGEKPQIAKGVTTQIADDSAREVEKWEVRRAYNFGGEQIAFTQDEQNELRNFGSPVIRIIGFKPLSALPIWASMKHPTFIYPSEEGYVGSTRAFSALHQVLLKEQKMALVWFIPRKNAAPVMGAMIPGEEELDENDEEQIMPPGMWILPLPFADDVRQNPETTNIVAPEPLVDKMRAIVQLLQLPKAKYDPRRYPNPGKLIHPSILFSIDRSDFNSAAMALPDPPGHCAGRGSPRTARGQDDSKVQADPQGMSIIHLPMVSISVLTSTSALEKTSWNGARNWRPSTASTSSPIR